MSEPTPSQKPVRLLIVGANSYVGTSVEHYLLRAGGFEVTTVSSRPGGWDKLDFRGFDAVLHVAGIAHVDPDPKQAPLYYKVNRDLTEAVACKAREAGVGQFLFMSSMIVYRASKSLKGCEITAETLPEPNDFYGDSKLQAEDRLRALESEQFRVCILRPCMIYGPGCRGNFPRLMELALRTPVFPEWHCRRSMLYIDNLSEFVRQALMRKLAGTYHLQNCETSDTVELIRYFAQAAKHRIWISKLFNPLVRMFSPVLKPLPKLFADQFYSPSLTTFGFDYQLVSLPDSLDRMATAHS